MSLIPFEHRAPAVVERDPWLVLGDEWLANFISAGTRATYRAAWKDFRKWFKGHPSNVTRADVIGYREHLAVRLKPATIKNRLDALASFYEHVKAERLIDRNPVEGVEKPNIAEFTAARWLTESQARDVLQQPDRTTLKGKRDYAILVAMLTMGLRRAEVVAIRVKDLSLRGDGTGELLYKPKGGTEESRPMPAAAWRAMQEYISGRGPLERDAPVFVAHDHALTWRAHPRPLTGEALRHMIKRYTEKALGHAVNPHAFRHTAATAAWDQTRDMKQVQRLMGHAHMVTTERYIHHVEDDRAALGTALAQRWGIE